jgi:hypothetical protein
MEILRDEYLDYLTSASARRPLFVELFGLLVGLEDEWRAQGAGPQELDLSAFGFDHVRRHDLPVTTGIDDAVPEVLLEETATDILQRDRYGRRVRLIKSSATIPLPLDHPVTDMDSWLRIKPRFEYGPGRLARGWCEEARAARDRGSLVVAHIPGGFDEPRQLMGEEALCYALVEQPELIHDMLETIGATAGRVLDEASRQVTVDVLSVHEDLAGRSGPLLGPAMVAEFIRPYYRRVWDLLAARRARVFQQDSDGNMNPVIDAFLDCGITCMYPMEPAAGMDIVAVRRRHGPRLAVLGGLDKHVLRRSRHEIRAELEYKLQPSMRTGGVVFGLDHRIPNGTPLEHYRYYVRTAREILGLDPNPGPGWARMAF